MILCKLAKEDLEAIEQAGVLDYDRWSRKADEEYVKLLDRIVALRTSQIPKGKLFKQLAKERLRREIMIMFSTREELIAHAIASNLPSELMPIDKVELKSLLFYHITATNCKAVSGFLPRNIPVDDISVDIDLARSVHWILSNLDNLKSAH